MTLNALDVTLQTVCPTIMCPRYEPLKRMEDDGHRFILGCDGLYVEVRRSWVHAILKVVDSPIPLPYGQPPALFDLRLHRKALVGGVHQFIHRARSASPNEYAAWLTYDPSQMSIGYVEPEIISQGHAHIHYQRPDATAQSLPIIDCHSHGRFAAFFSGTDDVDDLCDDVKIALVVGDIDQPTPSVAMRFIAFGLKVDLSDFARSLAYDTYITPPNESPENHDRC